MHKYLLPSTGCTFCCNHSLYIYRFWNVIPWLCGDWLWIPHKFLIWLRSGLWLGHLTELNIVFHWILWFGHIFILDNKLYRNLSKNRYHDKCVIVSKFNRLCWIFMAFIGWPQSKHFMFVLIHGKGEKIKRNFEIFAAFCSGWECKLELVIIN